MALIAHYKLDGNTIDSAQLGSSTTTVNFTTQGQYTFTVPSYIKSISVIVKGASGAGGTVGGWSYGSSGGEGGITSGVIQVTPGATYNIVVGGGGIINSTTNAYGGGGVASYNSADNRYGGGGGGYSGIFLPSGTSQATAILVAGGGGGGGSQTTLAPNYGCNNGGAGGGSSGEAGKCPSVPSYAGNPGSQTATGANASCDAAQRSDGGQGALQGGGCLCNCYGGAGGGGYWGGSAGGYYGPGAMGGGAGGSGYVNTAYATATTSSGSGAAGGTYQGNGSNGSISIIYAASKLDAINSGATYNSLGKIGGCYDFNSGANAVYVNNLVINGTVSISAWGYTNSATAANNRMLFSFSNNGGPDLYFTTGTICWNIGDGASNPFKNNGVNVTLPSSSVWHHYTVVNNKELNTTILYVDGAYYGTAIYKTCEQSSMFVIGNYLAPANWTYAFLGSIDDFKIFDHALSPKKIKELSKAKVLHYKFDALEEYTVNLNTYPLDNWNGSAFEIPSYNYDASGLATFTRQSMSGNPINSPYVMRYYTGGTGYKYWAIEKTGLTAGTYTFSYYARLVNTGATNNVNNGCMWRCDGVDKYPAGINPTFTNTWTRYVSTATIVSYVNIFLIHGASITGGYTIDFCGFQLEQKDHATPWVNGTRKDEVTDSSGYSNDGVFRAGLGVNNITTALSKLGDKAIRFFGLNDSYVSANYSMLKITTNFSWSLWAYQINENVQHGAGTIANSHIVSMGRDVVPHGVCIATNGVSIWVSYGTVGIEAPFSCLNRWRHITFTHNTSTGASLYIDGVLQSAGAAQTIDYSQASGGFVVGKMSFQYTEPNYYFPFNGYIDDARIYASTLNQNDITELYQTRGNIDSKGSLIAQTYKEIGFAYKPSTFSQVDYSVWVNGTSGAQGPFGINGSTNAIIVKPNPVGVEDLVWATMNSPDGAGGPNGGWNGNTFSVNTAKTYRYTVWMKYENLSSGNFYFGPAPYGSNQVDPSGANPYGYAISLWSVPIDTWILYTMFVYPYGGTKLNQGKAYRSDGSIFMNTNQDFNWSSGTSYGNHRTYHFYSPNPNCYVYFYRPRVDLIDGNEPTIGDLLACRENPNLYNLTTNKGLQSTGKYIASEFNEV